MRKKNKFSIFFWCDVVCSTKNIDVISCCRFSYKKALIHKRFLTNCSIIIIQRVFLYNRASHGVVCILDGGNVQTKRKEKAREKKQFCMCFLRVNWLLTLLMLFVFSVYSSNFILDSVNDIFVLFFIKRAK